MKTKPLILTATLSLGLILLSSCVSRAANTYAPPVITAQTAAAAYPAAAGTIDQFDQTQYSPGATPAQTQTALLSPADMDTLTGPIALYPDALIGIILPASTYPGDIVLAARFLEANGDNAAAQNMADSQPWDQSVRALAHYPDVLHWMDENLAWTQQLGASFLAQPEDMMASLQRLRAQAQTAGNLTTNAQQTIVAQDNYIRIVPTQPEVIYVPYYDPTVVFYSPVTFGWSFGWSVGPWLVYDCNWFGFNVWMGSWSPRFFMAPQWRMVNRRPPPPQWVSQHTWRPDPARRPARPPAFASTPQQKPTIVRPTPIANIRPAGTGNSNSHGNSNNYTNASAPNNLRHQSRPAAPQNRPSSASTPTSARATASTPTTTIGDVVKQSLAPSSHSQTQAHTQRPQTQSGAQTPQSQNNNTGNVTNTNGRRNVQRPVSPPPSQNSPQGQTAQQTSQRPAQQQTHRSNQSSSEQRPAGYSNGAPANSGRPNSNPPQSSQQSSGNSNSSASSSAPPPAQTSASSSSSSSTTTSSSSSSSTRDSSSTSSGNSSSRSDSGIRPRR